MTKEKFAEKLIAAILKAEKNEKADEADKRFTFSDVQVAAITSPR
jgi:hypothetical protein